jgi:triosephosphate isomerase
MKIIAANFKMNGDKEFIDNWFQNFDADTENLVVVGLPAIYLESSIQNFNKSNFKIAAQNVSKFINPGAYTGQMSSAMLNDVGVEFCIVGHSEAREHLCEDNQSVYEKYCCLKSFSITPIVCIGESLEIREAL